MKNFFKKSIEILTRFIIVKTEILDFVVCTMRYFIFMDESGNNFEDKYFALWLLFIPDYLVWYIYDDVQSYYDRAKDIAKAIKYVKVQEFIDKAQFSDLKNLLKSQTNFELKFKNINFTNKDIYKWMIDKVCLYHEIQYITFIVDKKSQDKDYSYWENYINYAAQCISENIEDENDYIFISDSITQPKWEKQKWRQFENFLKDTVCKYLKTKWKKTDNFLWVIRIESHSSVLLQLTDTILWCVMYFIRLKNWAISEKSKMKKWVVAETLKNNFWNIDYSSSQTIKFPFKFTITYLNK